MNIMYQCIIHSYTVSSVKFESFVRDFVVWLEEELTII